MKNFIIILAGVAAAAVSCQKGPVAEIPLRAEEGVLKLAVSGGSASKASSNTGLQGLELIISDVQIAVFNAENSTNATGKAGCRQYYGSYGSQRLDNANNTSGCLEAISLPAGDYSVYAVVNGPDISKLETISGLNALEVPFDEWNGANAGKLKLTDPVHDLVQAGCANVTVKAGQTKDCPASVVVPVKRLAARVRLVGITNNLPEAYGEVLVKRVFLANVIKQEVLGADANLDTVSWRAKLGPDVEVYWGNCWGRSSIGAAASMIGTGGCRAYSPENTFFDCSGGIGIASGQTCDKAAHSFYCYANPSPDYMQNPTGMCWQDWDALKASTELVAVVEVFDREKTPAESLGERYYRVPLRYCGGKHGAASGRNDDTGLLPNTSYTLALTLTALGPEDFQTIEKGCCSIAVAVSDWTDGGIIKSTL